MCIGPGGKVQWVKRQLSRWQVTVQSKLHKIIISRYLVRCSVLVVVSVNECVCMGGGVRTHRYTYSASSMIYLLYAQPDITSNGKNQTSSRSESISVVF